MRKYRVGEHNQKYLMIDIFRKDIMSKVGKHRQIQWFIQKFQGSRNNRLIRISHRMPITLGLERRGGKARWSSSKLADLSSKTLWSFAYASLPRCSCSPLSTFFLDYCWLPGWAPRSFADGPDSIRMKGDDNYQPIGRAAYSYREKTKGRERISSNLILFVYFRER